MHGRPLCSRHRSEALKEIVLEGIPCELNEKGRPIDHKWLNCFARLFQQMPIRDLSKGKVEQRAHSFSFQSRQVEFTIERHPIGRLKQQRWRLDVPSEDLRLVSPCHSRALGVADDRADPARQDHECGPGRPQRRAGCGRRQSRFLNREFRFRNVLLCKRHSNIPARHALIRWTTAFWWSLKVNYLARISIGYDGANRGRFPLALPCFHRLTGSGRPRETTRGGPEENSLLPPVPLGPRARRREMIPPAQLLP